MEHNRTQTRIYDRIAERASGYQTTYDVRVDGLTGEDEFVVTVFDHVGLKDTVLDMGCGDWSFTVRLGHRSGRVIGLDVSAPMLRYAKGNLLRTRNRNVFFVLGSGEALPLEDGSIDAVVSRRGLQPLDGVSPR